MSRTITQLELESKQVHIVHIIILYTIMGQHGNASSWSGGGDDVVSSECLLPAFIMHRDVQLYCASTMVSLVPQTPFRMKIRWVSPGFAQNVFGLSAFGLFRLILCHRTLLKQPKSAKISWPFTSQNQPRKEKSDNEANQCFLPSVLSFEMHQLSLSLFYAYIFYMQSSPTCYMQLHSLWTCVWQIVPGELADCLRQHKRKGARHAFKWANTVS